MTNNQALILETPMKKEDVAAASPSSQRLLNQTSFVALEQYTNDPFAYIRQSAVNDDLDMQVSAVEGAVLQWLVRFTKAKRVLEIGTFIGYSTAWLASGLPEDGKLITIEKSEDNHAQAASNLAQLEFAAMVELRCGDALDILPELADDGSMFDLVFIDANKLGYPEYVQWADRMLVPGGLLVIDDMLLFSGEISPKAAKMAAAIRYTREMVYDSGSYMPVILPMCHGLLLARKI